MSKTRKRTFIKYGITDKKILKHNRKSIASMTKCNRLYGYANLAYNLGLNYDYPLAPKILNLDKSDDAGGEMKP